MARFCDCDKRTFAHLRQLFHHRFENFVKFKVVSVAFDRCFRTGWFLGSSREKDLIPKRYLRIHHSQGFSVVFVFNNICGPKRS